MIPPYRLTTIALLLLACNSGGDETGGGSSSSSGETSAPGTSGSTSGTTAADDSSTASPTTAADDSSTGSTSDPTVTSSGATHTTSDGDTGTSTSGTTGEPLGACAADGGICMGANTCVAEGGTIAPSSPGECHFDDIDAECCIPPPAKPDPATCTEAGGLCAPIGGCLQTGGYFTTNDAGCEFMGNFACCVPHDACGELTIECCDGQAAYNPACNEGVFACEVGEPVPVGTCL